MKRQTLKITALFLIMVMVFMAAGCRKTDTGSADSSYAVTEENIESQADISSVEENSVPFSTEKEKETNAASPATEEESEAPSSKLTAPAKESRSTPSAKSPGASTDKKPSTAAPEKQPPAAATVTTVPALSPAESQSNAFGGGHTPSNANSLIQGVFQRVNQERSAAGLSSLTYCDALQGAADTRAREIITAFSHTRPDGTQCFTAFNVSYQAAGENIAYGYKSAASVMDGWMNSPGHRSNILSENFTQIAVGVVEENGVLYWVQLFIG